MPDSGIFGQLLGARGAAVLAVLVAAQPAVSALAKLKESLQGVLSKKHKWESDKERLECFKLYLEIQAIRKEHGLQGVAPAVFAEVEELFDSGAFTAKVKFPPRIKIRDLQDFWIDSLVSVCYVTVLIALALIPAYLFRSFQFFLATYALMVFIFSATYLHRLEAVRDGLRFVRLAGSPTFLAWKDIRKVVHATRKEVVRAWLWPFPRRETTTTFTTKGHYRIEWEGGYCYYPPKESELFEKVLRDHNVLVLK